MEIIGSPVRGMFRDILKGANDDVIYDSGWVSNTIVDRCRMLLAGFMKNDPSGGIKYLAVGQGKESWDEKGSPEPGPASISLVNQCYPPIYVTDSLHFDMDYLDEDDAEVVKPTSRLQITVTLEPGYPRPLQPLTTFPLREFGLFGTLNGTDYMIDCIRHPVIHKDESATLIREIRLYF